MPHVPTLSTPLRSKPCGNAWILAAGGSLLLFLWAHHGSFFNPYIVNDDTRQQLFWMQRWLNPDLYPPDLLNEYAPLYVTWGIKGLYYTASFFVDPLAFSKILTGVLYTAMGTLVYLAGWRVNGRPLGFTVLSVYWFMPFFLHAMSGGLARAFAGPLLLLFFHGWLMRSRWVVGAALVLQSLFIPYIFILCGGASGLGWLAWRLKLAGRPPFLARFGDFILAGSACALLLVWKQQMTAAGFGPLPWLSDMIGKPEFTASGRFLILPVPSFLHELFIRPWEFIAPFRDQNNAFGILGLFLIIPLAVYGGLQSEWRKWRPCLGPLICLALSSVSLYAVARILLFKLFLPSRYLEYSVNVGYCLLLGTCVHGILFRRLSLSRSKAAACLIVLSLVGCYRNTGIGLYDYSADSRLYSVIQEKTPTDAMIAGPPALMDNILAFGKRNVFASYELAHPWSQGYWNRLKPRLHDLFQAYYAHDLSEIKLFCRRHSIDFLVVDKRCFTQQDLNGNPFFEPFGEQIRRTAAKGRKFILSSPSLCSLRIDGNLCLVDTRTLFTENDDR